jgi:hypothetical protein
MKEPHPPTPSPMGKERYDNAKPGFLFFHIYNRIRLSLTSLPLGRDKRVRLIFVRCIPTTP